MLRPAWAVAMAAFWASSAGLGPRGWRPGPDRPAGGPRSWQAIRPCRRWYSRLAVEISHLAAGPPGPLAWRSSARGFLWPACSRELLVLQAGQDLALHDAVAFLHQHLADDAGGAGGDLDHPAFDVRLAVGDGHIGALRRRRGGDLGGRGLLGVGLVGHEHAAGAEHRHDDEHDPDDTVAEKSPNMTFGILRSSRAPGWWCGVVESAGADSAVTAPAGRRGCGRPRCG